jgi:uncharacterized protein YutE (UPF0331/DUF86 family)
VTFLMDADVVMAKVATVRRCLRAIRKVGETDPPLQEWMAQDLYVLNLQRAIQACLDLAHHLIGANRFDLPRSAAQAMEILAREGVIPGALCATMVAMVGFRNIAVHEYAALDPVILRAIVDKHLPDVEAFTARILSLLPAQER